MQNIAVVSHDAGGAEILSAWVNQNPHQYHFFLTGPALPIFTRKIPTPFKNRSLEDFKSLLNQFDLVLTGTSYQSDLEKEIIRIAKGQVYTVAFLDHWCNYPKRFQFEGKIILPDEIWVGDKDAYNLALKSFPSQMIVQKNNPYFEEIKQQILQVPSVERQGTNILYVTEPTSEYALKQYGDTNYFGYTEFEALKNYLESLSNQTSPISALRLRLHPSEDPNKYESVIETFVHIPISYSQSSLAEDCAWADWVVGCQTMAMVIGVVAGKKVFSCIPAGGRPCVLPQEEIIHLFQPSRRVTKPFLLIEDFPESKSLPDYSRIIALTPEAAFALSQKGITYSILEDFYQESQLLSFGSQYFHEQMAWMLKIDYYLQDNISELKERNITLLRSQHYQVKYMLDSFVAGSFILREFFQKSSPEQIIYLKREKVVFSHPVYAHEVNDRRYLLPVLEILCKERAVTLEVCYEKPEADFKGSSAQTKNPSSIKRFLKSFYFFFKYKKILRLLAGKSLTSCLFLDSYDRNIGRPLREFIQGGYRVFLKEEEEIIRIDSLIHRQVLDIHKNAIPITKSIEPSFKLVVQKLIQEPEIKEWFTKQSQIDLWPLVSKALSDFIQNKGSQLLSKIMVLEKFYAEFDINFVIARAATDEAQVSGLLAAKRFSQIKKVGFQHGADSRESLVALDCELNLFDDYFAMEENSYTQMLEGKRCSFINPSRIHYYSDFLAPLAKNKSRIKRSKETILYVPARPNVFMRMINHLEYPAVWYYHLQQELLKMFSQHTDKQFIFKYVMRNDWFGKSILPWIKKQSFSNVRVENKPLIHYFALSDRVLIDFPGTSMFEAAAAELPLLTLCPKWIPNRRYALELFGNSLQCYGSIKEAVEISRKFISDSPVNYRVHLSIMDEPPLKVLEVQ